MRKRVLTVIGVFGLMGSEAFMPGVCVEPPSLLIALHKDTQQREGLWLREFTWASSTYTRSGRPWAPAPFILNNLILAPSQPLL